MDEESQKKIVNIVSNQLKKIEKDFIELLSNDEYVSAVTRTNTFKEIGRMSRHLTNISIFNRLLGEIPYMKEGYGRRNSSIELFDIINLITKIPKNKNGTVYVLVCEGGKFYVGYTTNLTNRLETHKTRIGPHWTNFYPVISLLFSFSGTLEDENMMTLLMAHCVGEYNVTGGKWAHYKYMKIEDDIKPLNELIKYFEEKQN